MRQFCPLGCSPCLIHHWMFYSIQPGRLYGRCPDCGGACPALGAHNTFSELPICGAAEERMTGASEEDKFLGCLQSNDKTYCVQFFPCTVSIMCRLSFMCTVSDEAKYCKATSATHKAQSSQESKVSYSKFIYKSNIYISYIQDNKTFSVCTRLRLQRTSLLKNSQDNDKLPLDLNAAQTIIHVAEHKVKSFTAVRTHLHEFYEFLDKRLS